MRRFGAPWDRQLLTSTIALLAVIAITAIVGTAGAIQANLRGIALAVTGSSPQASPSAPGPSPRAASPSAMAGSCNVRNGWPSFKVRLEDVRSVAILEPNALNGSLKIFGMGGLFGYYGLFRSPTLGSYRLHATRSGGLVLVRTATHTHVLTPDPPDDFAEALLAAAPRARRERLRPAR